VLYFSFLYVLIKMKLRWFLVLCAFFSNSLSFVKISNLIFQIRKKLLIKTIKEWSKWNEIKINIFRNHIRMARKQTNDNSRINSELKINNLFAESILSILEKNLTKSCRFFLLCSFSPKKKNIHKDFICLNELCF
jgi:hypothetical protein